MQTREVFGPASSQIAARIEIKTFDTDQLKMLNDLTCNFGCLNPDIYLFQKP